MDQLSQNFTDERGFLTNHNPGTVRFVKLSEDGAQLEEDFECQRLGHGRFSWPTLTRRWRCRSVKISPNLTTFFEAPELDKSGLTIEPLQYSAYFVRCTGDLDSSQLLQMPHKPITSFDTQPESQEKVARLRHELEPHLPKSETCFYLPRYYGFRWTGLHAFLDLSKRRIAILHLAIFIAIGYILGLLGGQLCSYLQVDGSNCLGLEFSPALVGLVEMYILFIGYCVVSFWRQHVLEDGAKMREWVKACRDILSRLDERNTATSHAITKEVRAWETILIGLLKAMGRRP
ncbi:hypothetical protein WJX74_010539 [Apatococcus lobatus]|uniref:Uncharacterized protein n=1 Tax=Apatococcus lobatus TaxID=904363 RepID=A0AAW1R1F2_9CHLO